MDLQIHFYTSANHWSNQDIKNDQLRLSEMYRQQVISRLVEERTLPEASARRLRMTLVWDCWSVNLSEATKKLVRAMYPSIAVRFIPAGYTGKGQIGDTDLQKPLHASYEKAFKDRCVEMLVLLVHI